MEKKTDFPKITIVTPNYNMADYLEETILSVIGQNYPNLEYIIIDGGSTDGSVDIIKKYRKKIDFWISEPDSGMYDAIQKGFEKSSGEIMGWINSDDLLMYNSLFILADLFTDFPHVEWLSGIPVSTNKKSQIFENGNLKKWSKFHYYIGQYQWIQQESTYWRRSLWNKSGGSLQTELKYAGDFELWLRFFRYAKLYSTSAFIGSFRFRGPEQISSHLYDDYISEVNFSLKKELRSLTYPTQLKIILCHFYFFIYKVLRKLDMGQSIFERIVIHSFFDTPHLLIFDRIKQVYVLKKRHR